MKATGYRVSFTPTARAQAMAAGDYIAADSVENALRWLKGLDDAVASLATFPQRCPRTPESEHVGEELRHYIYHSHRVIYRIDERDRMVWVLHVRHGARRAIGEDPG